MDPAYTPGTGTPEPGGLTPRELFPLLRRLTAENRVVGIDVVEMNPLVDPGLHDGAQREPLHPGDAGGPRAPEAGHHHPGLPRSAGDRGRARPGRAARPRGYAPPVTSAEFPPGAAPGAGDGPARESARGRSRPCDPGAEDDDAPDPHPPAALAHDRPGAVGGGMVRAPGARRRGAACRRPRRPPRPPPTGAAEAGILREALTAQGLSAGRRRGGPGPIDARRARRARPARRGARRGRRSRALPDHRHRAPDRDPPLPPHGGAHARLVALSRPGPRATLRRLDRPR